MSIVFLKVKVKSLAAEAKIIRREEQRCKSRPADKPGRTELLLQLKAHRRDTVRREARHSLLALGYLRGRTYRTMERTCHQSPSWSEVERMVKKYGPPAHNTSFEDWRKESEQRKSLSCRAAGPQRLDASQ